MIIDMILVKSVVKIVDILVVKIILVKSVGLRVIDSDALDETVALVQCLQMDELEVGVLVVQDVDGCLGDSMTQ